MHIDMAKEQTWAWDGLRNLLRHMIENDEQIPEFLGTWGVYQLVKGGRPKKRGQPEEFDRDLRVWAVFTVLQSDGWSRLKAYDYIARLTGYQSRDIRGIISKLESRIRTTGE